MLFKIQRILTILQSLIVQLLFLKIGVTALSSKNAGTKKGTYLSFFHNFFLIKNMRS